MPVLVAVACSSSAVGKPGSISSELVLLEQDPGFGTTGTTGTTCSTGSTGYTEPLAFVRGFSASTGNTGTATGSTELVSLEPDPGLGVTTFGTKAASSPTGVPALTNGDGDGETESFAPTISTCPRRDGLGHRAGSRGGRL